MAFYDEMSDLTDFSISFTNSPLYDFGSFAEGYKFAANLIAQQLIEDTGFPDYQAYPVVFLYRHALELHLKNIIYKVAKFSLFKSIENIDFKLYNSHDLVMLSETACKILTLAFPNDSSLHQIAGKTAKISKEFAQIDPVSYSYRYPIKTTGEHSTERNQTVNLQSLAVQMDSLLSSLEVVDFGLDFETDIAQQVYELLESL